MRHIRLATRAPQTASINLDRFIEVKVETKENLINGKAGLFR